MTVFDGYMYYLVYFVLLGVSFIGLSKQGVSVSNFLRLFVPGLMICFIGLRWECGTDWTPYKVLFDNLELDWTFLLNVYHFDFGYVVLNAAVKFFTDNYTVFLLVNAAITIILLSRFIDKTSPYPALSFLMLYSVYFTGHFMGSNRRMIAIALLLLAFYSFYKGNKKKFILLIILGFLFHKTAIMGLIVLFIPKNRHYNLNNMIVVLGLCIIVGVFQIPYKIIQSLPFSSMGYIDTSSFMGTLNYYATDEKYIQNAGLIANMIPIIKRLLFFVLYIHVIKNIKIDGLTAFLFNIYVVGFMAYSLLTGSEILKVTTTYFAIVEISLFARMMFYMGKTLKTQLFVILAFYGMLLLTNGLNWEPSVYMPYRSIFG